MNFISDYLKKTPLIFVEAWLLAALVIFSAFQNAVAGAGATQASTTNSCAKIPVLILPIEFTDCKLTLTDEDWTKKVFSMPTKAEEDQRFDLFGYSGSSVNNYYKEITCGKFLLEPVAENSGTTNDGVIRVSLDLKHPGADVRGMVQAVSRAMSMASHYIDFSRYDLDKNKSLSAKELAIIVIAAGGQREPNTFSRNRCFHGRLNLGGIRKNGYVVVTERRDDLITPYQKLTQAAGVKAKYKDFPVSLGTLVHELGHSFGTADLYNIGGLTAMSGGQKKASVALFPGTKLEYNKSTPCHYGAYAMVKAGFVEPIILDKTGVFTVNSAGTGKYNVYKIPTKDPKEYFLVENRQFEGFDKPLGDTLKKAGIAIWHINEAFGNNTDMDKKLVDIEEASEGPLGYSHIKKNRRHTACDPFYPIQGNTEFSSNSKPSNLSYGGEPQPWKITDFSASAGVMTFKFTRL